MARHIAFTMVASLLIAGCMFYPFLPGRYDGLAVTLSAMAQLFGVVGLLLVPVGLLWFACEWKTRTKQPGAPPTMISGYWFSLASIGIGSLVALAVALGAVVDDHQSVGIFVLVLWVYAAIHLVIKVKRQANEPSRTPNSAPLYLIVLPIVAAVLKFGFVGRASEFSRNRAIDNGGPLIADIERYREVRGHYPRSLQSLWGDYDPQVIGIERYYYEPSGEAYNLYFENFSVELSAKEIVMYNPRGEHEFTSHNADLLQVAEAELVHHRGYFAVHDASRPNWKYFLFD